MEENPSNRWQLRDDCIFVDACELDNPDPTKPKKLPKEIPCPHIIDNIEAEPLLRKVTILSDFEGFIVRFIVMGVETKRLLPEIVASEYGISIPEAAGEVDKAEAKLLNLGYLVPRTTLRPKPGPPPDIDGPLVGKYQLDFSVRSRGGGAIKVPL